MSARTSFHMAMAAMAILGVTASSLSHGSEPRMTRVARAMLCVTEGSVEEIPGQRLSVNVPKMRAYVNRQTSQLIEVRFSYLGPTGKESPLGSGAMRRQFGLKLRAQDPCNLVYVMWRIEPKSEVVVSVKTNPGEHTSAECANRGYQNLRPVQKAPIPELRPPDTHILRSDGSGENLRVLVDDSVVWEGTLASDALQMDGPVGIRSDNAHVEFQLRVGQLPGDHPEIVLPCKSGPDESE